MVAFTLNNRKGATNHSVTKTPREKQLEAEVTKLKTKNKRLGSAMLSLVNHIEKKLPFLATRTPVLVAPPEDKTPPVTRPVKQHYESQETWKPAVLVQEKTGDVLLTKRANALNEKQATEIQSSETEAILFGNTPPKLEPHEIDILRSPTQEKKTSKSEKSGDENDVPREAEKTSAQQAAEAYEAVAVVSTPVPEENILKNGVVDDDPYRAAMRRRVNRLRW